MSLNICISLAETKVCLELLRHIQGWFEVNVSNIWVGFQDFTQIVLIDIVSYGYRMTPLHINNCKI